VKELVEYIVQGLVDEPDEVQVTPVEQGNCVVYQVEVIESDLGQVIGRRGRIANAMRTLIGSVRSDDGKRHTIDIVS